MFLINFIVCLALALNWNRALQIQSIDESKAFKIIIASLSARSMLSLIRWKKLYTKVLLLL